MQSMAGLRKRGVNPQNQGGEPMDLGEDAMLEDKCLLEPNPTLAYMEKDTLRAFVRIYLADNVDNGSLNA